MRVLKPHRLNVPDQAAGFRLGAKYGEKSRTTWTRAQTGEENQ